MHHTVSEYNTAAPEKKKYFWFYQVVPFAYLLTYM